MAASDIDICAQALELLGLPPISGFDDDRTGATCGRHYDDLMDTLMAIYPWKFCRKYVALSRTVVTPPLQWRFEYVLPPDIVLPGVYSVYDNSAEGAAPFKHYEIVNNKRLYADAQQLFMSYTIRPPEGDWPPHFYNLAILAVAARLAKPLTEDNELAVHWQGVAFGSPSEAGQGGFFRTARNTDAQQSPPARLHEYTLLEARVGDGLPDFR